MAALFSCFAASGQVRLTEFMASNTRTLADEDGDASDWIEIQNTSSKSVSLLNWALTDSAGNPGKWRFPATNLPPQSFMVVFADGKDRAIPGAPLHTNFKLGADGEYLALVSPGQKVATEIAPAFPSQFPDVSYGIGMQLSRTALVATNAAIHFLIPANSSVDAGWTQVNFKKSHNLDFPKDHQFLYRKGGAREKKIVFLSNYGDKARICTTLTYATTALSGGMGLFSFPIRIQLNGSFWGIEDMVEHGDDLWLSRIGRDDDGALYKMYNNLSSASGNEKKTRTYEGTDDLSALIASLDETLPLTNRIAYACDNLDLPQTANYFAEMALASSQDLSAKNYYLYRDSDGNGEWAICPWDVDLTWGRNWIDAYGYFTDTIYTNNVLSFDNPAQQYKPANRLFDLFFASADFRQMYLRRLRTLMDTILMPPGTPSDLLVIEPLIRQYEAALNFRGFLPRTPRWITPPGGRRGAMPA